MNARIRAYVARYHHTLLNAAIIFVVFVVGIAARPYATVATVARIQEWFGIVPEMTALLFLFSAMLMSSPWYSAKYLALAMPAVYAATAFAQTLSNQSITVVAGLGYTGLLVLMSAAVRTEQRECVTDGQ
jgi:hypothetical protein